jgi:hypothetical protein
MQSEKEKLFVSISAVFVRIRSVFIPIRGGKSNSNNLANQLDIHLILAKPKNEPPIIWQINLAKIKTWQNSPPRAQYARADVVAIVVSL